MNVYCLDVYCTDLYWKLNAVPIEYRILILLEKTDPHRRAILIQKKNWFVKVRKLQTFTNNV